MTTAEYPAYDGTQVCATVDPEEFHPELGESVEAARKICKGDPARGTEPCSFLDPCLQYALHHKVSGVWAGTSAEQRRKMRLKLHIIAEPLSFGTGPTNVATATRMAARGTPVARIAEHLQITQEAVARILRAGRSEPAGTLDAEGRKACPDCGRRMKPDSMRKHKRAYCAGSEAVA